MVNRVFGNRVSSHVELQGLDVPELGTVGYLNQDTAKAPESSMTIQRAPEPRPAKLPPNGQKRFSILVEGVDLELLARVWSDLCQVGEQSPSDDFRAVYPYMTTVQGNRFRFRGGDPNGIRTSLERLLQKRTQGQAVRVRLEG